MGLTYHDTVLKDGDGNAHFPRTDMSSVHNADGTKNLEMVLAEEEAIFTPPNKILSMPTKPTYSGGVITVYAGTKVSMPNGRNADGTVKNTIFSLATNKTITVTYGSKPQCCCLIGSGGLFTFTKSNFYIYDFANRPTTVPSTGVYFMYCPDTNLHYYTTDNVNANWKVDSIRFMLCDIYTNTTSITSLKINDVYNAGQEVDKINTNLNGIQFQIVGGKLQYRYEV